MSPTYEAAWIGDGGNRLPYGDEPISGELLGIWYRIARTSMLDGNWKALEVRDLSTGQLVRIKPRSRA